MENVSTSKIFQKRLKIEGKLFGLEEKSKSLTAIKNESHLLDSKSFQQMQLVDPLKTPWQQPIGKQNANLNGLSI